MRETVCKCTIFGENYSFLAGDRKPTDCCYYLCLEFKKFSFCTFFNLRLCLRYYYYSRFFIRQKIYKYLFSLLSTNCNNGWTQYLPSCTKSDRDQITVFGWVWCWWRRVFYRLWCGGGGGAEPRTQLWQSWHRDPASVPCHPGSRHHGPRKLT